MNAKRFSKIWNIKIPRTLQQGIRENAPPPVNILSSVLLLIIPIMKLKICGHPKDYLANVQARIMSSHTCSCLVKNKKDFASEVAPWMAWVMGCKRLESQSREHFPRMLRGVVGLGKCKTAGSEAATPSCESEGAWWGEGSGSRKARKRIVPASTIKHGLGAPTWNP